MTRLSISKAWEEAQAILAREGRLYASVALALVVLPQTVIGLFSSRSAAALGPRDWMLLIISIIFGFAAQIALNRLAIGPSTTVGEAIGRGFARMPVMLGAFVLLIIPLFILLIFLVLVLSAVGLVASPGTTPEPPWSVILLLIVSVAFCYAIFQLAVPVAAVESGGPIHLLTRSWLLSRGAYWRLLAFVGILLVGLLVVLLAGQFVFGSVIAAALGPPQPGSLSALLISLVVATIQSVFTVIFGVMLARIYVQLSGHRGASVPKSGI